MSDAKSSWFNRYGSPVTRGIFDANEAKGTAKHTYQDVCSRCGGAGASDKWMFTGRVCFDCRGNGKGPIRTEPVYTAEKLAALNAAQAKRNAVQAAKLAAAQAAEAAAAEAVKADSLAAYGDVVEGMRKHEAADTFLADLLRKFEQAGKLSEKQVEAARNTIARLEARAAERAASQFVAEVGKRIEVIVTVERIIPIPCGCSGTRHYCFGPRSIYLLRDDNGNRLVYKGGSHIASAGVTVLVKATVDGHESYKDENQTIIARPKVLAYREDDGKLYVWDSEIGGAKEYAPAPAKTARKPKTPEA